MSEILRQKSVQMGMSMASKFFEKRGSHSEVHLNINELASLLAVAFEVGYENPSIPTPKDLTTNADGHDI